MLDYRDKKLHAGKADIQRFVSGYGGGYKQQQSGKQINTTVPRKSIQYSQIGEEEYPADFETNMNDNTSMRPSQFDDDIDYGMFEKQRSGKAVGMRHQKTEK